MLCSKLLLAVYPESTIPESFRQMEPNIIKAKIPPTIEPPLNKRTYGSQKQKELFFPKNLLKQSRYIVILWFVILLHQFLQSIYQNSKLLMLKLAVLTYFIQIYVSFLNYLNNTYKTWKWFWLHFDIENFRICSY